MTSKERKILLVGNPNVGKSALFSRLTGINVTVSNYPGTTVDVKSGKIKTKKIDAELIDVPGIYSLKATCDAEDVSCRMLDEGNVIVNVVDVTNLERNLYLTLQLLERKVPVIVALNFWDEREHKGISIDAKKLQKILGVPVVPTVAVSGEGINILVGKINDAKRNSRKTKNKWEEIGKIVSRVQTIRHHHHTFFQTLEDFSIKPATGIPLATVVIFLTFMAVRLIGEGLIRFIFNPLFSLYLAPVNLLSQNTGGFLHSVLIGTLINGKVDFLQSMGLLTTGIYVPLAMILPYVFAFYLVLGLLEDSGYLPRLAALVDSVMHRLGMHGLAIIPMMLGAGCNVPGVLATRILETKRQRFIAITLTAIAMPCMAQTAMIYGLLGRYGIRGIGTVFATLFVVWVVVGIILNRMSRGDVPETFLEVVPYRIPILSIVAKKLWVRIRYFSKDAVPYMLLGVFIINMLYFLGIISFLGNLASPIIVQLFGLPREAVAALVVGFFRKDVAVGMLLPLGLSMKQLIIASVVLTMYFPCIATFAVIFKELGIKNTLKSVAIMVGATLAVGGMLNLIL
ncbi:ferrous iron transporter B [Candidatus Woesearchaeota archaeon]|nr:ferrous iron transporter B [Candidatus Woesearchaeota archaeon]